MMHVLFLSDEAATDPRAAVQVWYDGGCPVCRREIGWYGRMSGADAVRWLDVSDPATAVPDGWERADLLARFTVRRRDGGLAQGAEGFSALWRALGPTRLLGKITDRQPFRAVGAVLYRGFLAARPLWRTAP